METIMEVTFFTYTKLNGKLYSPGEKALLSLAEIASLIDKYENSASERRDMYSKKLTRY